MRRMGGSSEQGFEQVSFPRQREAQGTILNSVMATAPPAVAHPGNVIEAGILKKRGTRAVSVAEPVAPVADCEKKKNSLKPNGPGPNPHTRERAVGHTGSSSSSCSPSCLQCHVDDFKLFLPWISMVVPSPPGPSELVESAIYDERFTKPDSATAVIPTSSRCFASPRLSDHLQQGSLHQHFYLRSNDRVIERRKFTRASQPRRWTAEPLNR